MQKSWKQTIHSLNTQHLINLETKYGASNYKPLDVVISRGEGVWVEDVDGKKYLDCLSAYSAVNQGHCHPRILQTMIEQAQKLTLTSRAFRNDQLGLFYEEVCELTNSHKVLPMNSGAEAVETAVKTVRKWGYQVKGVPEDQARTISTAGQLPSWDSAPMKVPAPDLGRSRPGSGSFLLVTLKPWKMPSPPMWLDSWSNRFRARPA